MHDGDANKGGEDKDGEEVTGTVAPGGGRPRRRSNRSTNSRKSSSGSADSKGDLKKYHILHGAVREERDEGKGTSARFSVRLIPPQEMVPSAQGNTGKEIRRTVHGERG